LNCGKSGIDTRQDIEIMKHLAVKPEILFWQYFFNDIEGAMSERKINYELRPMSDVAGISKFFVMNSFAFNYLYWLRPHNDLENYISAFEKGVQDTLILQKHKKDLDYVITYCTENNIKLTVVLYPLLIFSEKKLFNKFTSDIDIYFKSENIETINVIKLTKKLKLSDKVVNNLDIHGSKKVNKLVANEILK
jgi:hypothetical protein